MTNPEVLTSFPLFAGLDSAALAPIARQMRRAICMPDSVVMSMDQPGDEAFLIVDGSVQIIVDRTDGSSPILALLGRGALVGELGVVQRLGRSATVVAIERTTLLGLHRTTFHEILRSQPQIAHNLNDILAQRLRLANAQILTLTTPEIVGRLARMLLTYAHEYGERELPDNATRIPFRLTQSDLARLIGSSRASVNKAMGMLVAEGLVRVERYQCIVTNSTALERYCL